jgi:hypothetical protein
VRRAILQIDDQRHQSFEQAGVSSALTVKAVDRDPMRMPVSDIRPYYPGLPRIISCWSKERRKLKKISAQAFRLRGMLEAG